MYTEKEVTTMKMNQLLTATILTASSLMATVAMAAPHDGQPERHQPQAQHQQQARHQSAPSRDLRAGQPIPAKYRSARYQVDHRAHKNLTPAKRGQQWYKVNGHYVLVSQHDHRILRTAH